MPNWCECRLTVSGPAVEDDTVIRDFRDRARHNNGDYKTDLSLNSFVPLPKALEGTRSPVLQPKTQLEADKLRLLVMFYGATNWYDWCIANWGTKWDVDAKLEMDELNCGFLEYHFASAWGPPITWLEKVAAQYPTLTFVLKYDEPGMCFMGVATGSEGTVVDQYVEY